MQAHEQNDPFLHQRIDALGDSPMQRKLRHLCPLPVGVVYIQQSEPGKEEIRRELRSIVALGISTITHFESGGETPLSLREAELLALEEGLIPHWYGIGGWAEITNELLHSLGIPTNLPIAEVQRHPALIAHQTEILKARAQRRDTASEPAKNAATNPELCRLTRSLTSDQIPTLIEWLKARYNSPEQCARAYQAFGANTWEQIGALFVPAAENALKVRTAAGFRQIRDTFRFQADQHAYAISQKVAWHLSWDQEEPVRAECALCFENQALYGNDCERLAQGVYSGGSLSGASRPHHPQTNSNQEPDIPDYLAARMVADFAKGGWPTMDNVLGGATIYSDTPIPHRNGDALVRCLLSYLAAGVKGISISAWNAPDSGWGIGEGGLCDLAGKPTDRARAVGTVARACETWRFELWEARDEPLVGILYSWENDAAFARLSLGASTGEEAPQRAVYPSEARMGAARALIHGNIPFEFVTERDLAKGLADRYRHIYVPHTLCLSASTLQQLREFAERGGHVLLDAPTLLINADTGSLFDTRQGTDFERLFGFEHAGMQYTSHQATTLDGLDIDGQLFDVNVTTARVSAMYDGTERPAVLENEVGNGRATAFTFELSRLCFRPGNILMENLIENYVLGWDVAPWRANTDRVLIYRRVAPNADHYFIINPDDQSHRVRVAVRDRPNGYLRGEDCISGKSLIADGANFSLALPAGSARWVRMGRG